ncbi:MAG: triose-phosphate isomerase [Geminicoccaceae bacterium]|nr:triose-phosphate isomerase [Geminicoccaceae bacterium]
MTDCWIGTSWKMNKTLAQAQSFAQALVEAEDDPRIRRFVIPPFTMLREVATMLAPTSVEVGAQNMHWADAGAWTGEISPLMLTDCGVDLVEIGHSERRTWFGETDETVGLKVAAALRHGLIPLICIGETALQKKEGRAEKVLAAQVEGALRYIEEGDRDILFAYEPVWAIGDGGTPATPDYADRQHKLVKTLASDICGRPIPCLYGGSVGPDNCRELIASAHVDGLFIGRAAWDVKGYLRILDACAEVL